MIKIFSKVPLQALSISDGVHLVVKLKINNRVARMIVDTGASRTVLDKTRGERFLQSAKSKKHSAASTGLGGNEIQTFTSELNKIKIGSVTKKNLTWLLMDLSHVNVIYRQMKMKPVDGILGSDFLQENYAVIDYLTHELSLR